VPVVGSIDDLIEATIERSAPASAHLTRDAECTRRREEAEAAADQRLVTQLKKGVTALLDKKADKLVVLHLTGLTTMADYFVVATATSDRQAQTLADAVEAALRTEGRRPLSVEGYRTAAWILMDYGDVVFHVFHEESRRFYGLERLWGDAPDATAAFR